jgi:hypothetical protein
VLLGRVGTIYLATFTYQFFSEFDDLWGGGVDRGHRIKGQISIKK